jgi:hypothetical protein
MSCEWICRIRSGHNRPGDKSLEIQESAKKTQIAPEKSLSFQGARNAPKKFFQTFLWPLWAISMG